MGTAVKTTQKDDELVSLSYQQLQQLRKELSQRVPPQELEALDHIFILSQADPLAFHKLWIGPLLAEGLSFDAAMTHIIQSYLWPN
jgi:hypothetical protein